MLSRNSIRSFTAWPKLLPARNVALGRLHQGVPEQELDLLDLSPRPYGTAERSSAAYADHGMSSVLVRGFAA